MVTKTIRTLGQRRSEFALVKVNDNINIKELKPLSSSVPSMILQNGLGHTLAFCYTRAEKKLQYEAILKIVEEWIGEKHPQFKTVFHGRTQKDFLMQLSTVDQRIYLSVQEETLALLEWVKRYANAFIKDKDSVQ